MSVLLVFVQMKQKLVDQQMYIIHQCGENKLGIIFSVNAKSRRKRMFHVCNIVKIMQIFWTFGKSVCSDKTINKSSLLLCGFAKSFSNLQSC